MKKEIILNVLEFLFVECLINFIIGLLFLSVVTVLFVFAYHVLFTYIETILYWFLITIGILGIIMTSIVIGSQIKFRITEWNYRRNNKNKYSE